MIATFAIALLAAEPTAAAPAAAIPPVPAAAQTPAAAEAPKRYCVKYELTGSRVPIKQCRTEEQWRRRGVDVNEFLRR